MERRALMISLGLSFFACYLVWQYISTEEQKLQEKYGTFFTMVVTTRDILQYETIGPTDVEEIRAPVAVRPVGYVSSSKAVVDAVSAVPMKKGEFILDNKIITRNVYSGLSSQVTPSRRAISIPVNPKSSVGYMLQPGNRVDLAAHFEYKAKGFSISEVKVFMQDLLVLASGRTMQTNSPKGVDQDIVRSIMSDSKISEEVVRESVDFVKNDYDYQTVTVEVTPQQAQEIVYVMALFNDSLVLMLRHSDDRSVSSNRSTTNLDDVMGPDSYLLRSRIRTTPTPVAIPRFFDFVGGQQRGVQ